jgi:WD40 repeat protein
VRSLQALVSHVRAVLEPDVRIVREEPGWMLCGGDVDAERLDRCVQRCRDHVSAGGWVELSGAVAGGLALWRGRAFDGFTDLDTCAAEAERLEGVRRELEEYAVESDLALGRAADSVDRLQHLVEAEPFREHRWDLLLLALYRAGRQEEALAAYGRLRRLLREELGVEPSPELRRRHAMILAHDPALRALLQRGPEESHGALESPYPALAAYTDRQAALFFGRERMVARVVARLSSGAAVTVAGVSGSGKSSLVNAGVLPALHGGALPGSDQWRIVRVTPGRAACLGDRGPCDLLVVDRLEELFTVVDAAQRAHVVAELMQRREQGTRLLMAIRSDFWTRCATEPGLATLVCEDTLLLGALRDEEVRRVVTEPARRWGVAVDDDLVDLVVETVAGRDGVLPLLSTALDRGWRLRGGGALTVAAYQEAGGVSDAVGWLADEAFESLDEEQRRRVRRLLLRLVVEGPQGVTRRRVPLAELDLAPDDPVLDALVGKRLVTVGDEGVEVVHEALFSAWPRMAAWLEDDAAGRRLRAHLSPAAAAWRAGGRRAEDLYAGARLAEASAVRAQDATLLSALEQEFLDASERHADAARHEALARAERESRSARRLRGLLVGAVVLLVLALVTTVLAVQARDRARRATSAADANRLSAQALLVSRPDLALQLAVRAVRLDPTAQTTSNLFATLLRYQRLVRVRHDPSRHLGAALSPDGRTLAVCDLHGLALLDPRTLLVRRTVAFGTSAPCSQPAFLDGGRLLATVALDRDATRLYVVRAADGTTVFSHDVVDGYFTYATPDSRRLLTEGTLGDTLWVRRADRWQERPLGRHRTATGFGLHARLFATSGRGGAQVRRRDGTVARRLDRPGVPVAVASSSDLLALQLPSGQVAFVHALSGRHAGSVAGSGRDSGQAYFADHDRLFVTSNLRGDVSVWDARSHHLVQSVSTGTSVMSSASPSGTALYTAGFDGTVARWDLTGHHGFDSEVRGVPHGVSDAVYLAGGLVVAVGSSVVSLSATFRATGRADLRSPVLSLTPDGPHDAVAVTRDGIALLTVRDRRPVVERLISLPGARAAAADASSGLVVAITSRGLTVVQADGERVRWPVPGTPSYVAVSPGGALAAVGLDDSSFLVLDASTGAVVSKVPGGGDDASLPVAFLDPHTLLVMRRVGTLVRWDLRRGRRIGDPVPAVDGFPWRMQVTRGMVTVSSAGNDAALVDSRTWRPVGGGPLPTGLDGPVTVLSPSGTSVAAVDAYGRAVEWPFRADRWAALACRESVTRLTEVEWREFVPARPYDPAC